MTAETAPVPSPPVAAALDRLRSRGERVTPARRAVLTVLAASADHLNADEIVGRAEAAAPGVHRATVYRALATLGELGLVSHTHIGGAATVYHLRSEPPAAAAGGHAHACCTVCQRVIDLPAEALAGLAERLDRDHGFRLEPQHAALLGICADCRR